MTVVGVLGAGAGGLASAVDLASAGHEVRLWNRSERRLAPYVDGVVACTGVLGEKEVRVASASTDLGVVLDGAEVVVVSVPALAHAAVFTDLANAGYALPVVLNPGHTAGALHARAVFATRGVPLPPVAEFSTLTYVARTRPGGGVRVTGRARQVRCGTLPGGKEALAAASALFPAASPVPDVLASSLSNINLVLHPPGAILAAAWVEAPGQAFTFYVDAMTPGVARVLEALDDERRAVASVFGHVLPSLVEEMALVGTVPADAAVRGVVDAVRAGEANRSLLAPDSLDHRYYEEDLAFGLVPFVALADVAEVAVPMARALLTVGGGLLGRDLLETGLGTDALGLRGLNRDDVLGLVRSP